MEKLNTEQLERAKDILYTSPYKGLRGERTDRTVAGRLNLNPAATLYDSWAHNGLRRGEARSQLALPSPATLRSPLRWSPQDSLGFLDTLSRNQLSTFGTISAGEFLVRSVLANHIKAEEIYGLIRGEKPATDIDLTPINLPGSYQEFFRANIQTSPREFAEASNDFATTLVVRAQASDNQISHSGLLRLIHALPITEHQRVAAAQFYRSQTEGAKKVSIPEHVRYLLEGELSQDMGWEQTYLQMSRSRMEGLGYGDIDSLLVNRYINGNMALVRACNAVTNETDPTEVLAQFTQLKGIDKPHLTTPMHVSALRARRLL